MRQYAVLRIMLAGFFMYFAWPAIPYATTMIEHVFWAAWIVFFLLVVGANLATLLQMTRPPVMEQEALQERQTAEN